VPGGCFELRVRRAPQAGRRRRLRLVYMRAMGWTRTRWSSGRGTAAPRARDGLAGSARLW